MQKARIARLQGITCYDFIRENMKFHEIQTYIVLTIFAMLSYAIGCTTKTEALLAFIGITNVYILLTLNRIKK